MMMTKHEYGSFETHGSQHPELRLQELHTPVKVIEGEARIQVDQEFTLGDLTSELKRAVNENTLFFTPELYTRLGLDGGYIEQAFFTERPDWRIGREDSKSQVFFGKLHLNVFEGGDSGETDSEHTIPIACKPFHGWVNGAVHEFTAYRHINELGFIKGFEPLGFWVDDDGKVFMLSQFEEKVKTLDNVDWSHSVVNDSLEEHFDSFYALERSAYTLGRFAAHGFIHRDARKKNMAFDGQAIRAVDLEQLRLIQTPDEPNLPAMESGVFTDAKDFMESVNEARFLRDASLEDKRAIINAHFIGPLIGVLRHPASKLRYNYGEDVVNMVYRIQSALQEKC